MIAESFRGYRRQARIGSEEPFLQRREQRLDGSAPQRHLKAAEPGWLLRLFQFVDDSGRCPWVARFQQDHHHAADFGGRFEREQKRKQPVDDAGTARQNGVEVRGQAAFEIAKRAFCQFRRANTREALFAEELNVGEGRLDYVVRGEVLSGRSEGHIADRR